MELCRQHSLQMECFGLLWDTLLKLKIIKINTYFFAVFFTKKLKNENKSPQIFYLASIFMVKKLKLEKLTPIFVFFKIFTHHKRLN